MYKNIHLVEREVSFTFDIPPIAVEEFIKEFSTSFAYNDPRFDNILRYPDKIVWHVSRQRPARIQVTIFGKDEEAFFKFMKRFSKKHDIAIAVPPEDLKFQVPKELYK